MAPSPDPGWYKSRLTTSLDLFQRVISYFAGRGYSFLNLNEYQERRGRHRGKEKVICITFDDGYLDNYVYAYPVLKKYSAKATIFVSPEFVDPCTDPRRTLEDVWNGKCDLTELTGSGFLSWEEMRLMEGSGHIDIQSHTMTHSKVWSSDEIRDFHHPGADWLYPIANLFPNRKPFYITDPDFPKLIPWGTPFFREESALTTRMISINPEFSKRCVEILSYTDWKRYRLTDCFSRIEPLYRKMKSNGTLIERVETEADYLNRLRGEIEGSKDVIEREMGKRVEHVCWPHGDYNSQCIETAFDCGYKSVHAVPGKGPVAPASFIRFGVTDTHPLKIISLARVVAKVRVLEGSVLFGLADSMLSRKRR